MARGALIGLCDCPECAFPDAEIRPDKGGAPYRYCPDCYAQYFSRGAPHKVKNLLAKIRAMAAEISPPTPPIIAAIVPVAVLKKNATETTATKAAPATRKAFSLGDL